MKNQRGSGRRGGARRASSDSKSYNPKGRGAKSKLSQKSSSSASSSSRFSLPTKKKTGFAGRRKTHPKLKSLADENAPMRLNRFVAQAGICSRREADVLIKAGVVSVNGKVVTEMG